MALGKKKRLMERDNAVFFLRTKSVLNYKRDLFRWEGKKNLDKKTRVNDYINMVENMMKIILRVLV